MSDHDTTILVAASNMLRSRALSLIPGLDDMPLTDEQIHDLVTGARQRVAAIIACRDAADAIDLALAELAAEELTT